MIPPTLWGRRSQRHAVRAKAITILAPSFVQIDGCRANAMMRGRPYPLQRVHCTSRRAIRIEACWRYVPCLFSLARFCWAHSEFKRPTTTALLGETMRSSELAMLEWC